MNDYDGYKIKLVVMDNNSTKEFDEKNANLPRYVGKYRVPNSTYQDFTSSTEDLAKRKAQTFANIMNEFGFQTQVSIYRTGPPQWTARTTYRQTQWQERTFNSVQNATNFDRGVRYYSGVKTQVVGPLP